mmetsp:Transcript_5904/g.13971  ORF Transcript_5904/g.13971 Transcript_5904/m.13971 type:complete len:267 (+) Transcript_5904:1565-2365(+)
MVGTLRPVALPYIDPGIHVQPLVKLDKAPSCAEAPPAKEGEEEPDAALDEPNAPRARDNVDWGVSEGSVYDDVADNVEEAIYDDDAHHVPLPDAQRCPQQHAVEDRPPVLEALPRCPDREVAYSGANVEGDRDRVRRHEDQARPAALVPQTRHRDHQEPQTLDIVGPTHRQNGGPARPQVKHLRHASLLLHPSVPSRPEAVVHLVPCRLLRMLPLKYPVFWVHLGVAARGPHEPAIHRHWLHVVYREQRARLSHFGRGVRSEGAPV